MSSEDSYDLSNQLKLALFGRAKDDSNEVWIPHPQFKGVYLKHIITGTDTDGSLSLHLVKVDPDCALAEHQHMGQLELHEVIQGEGVCRLEEQTVIYVPGTLTVIPLGSRHEVTAGAPGLFLKAIFTPALV